jgi:hypothetical protein
VYGQQQDRLGDRRVATTQNFAFGTRKAEC